MRITTSRFGRIDVDAGDILRFPSGLPGLEDCREWALLADASNDALGWLQSTNRGDVALAVVSPDGQTARQLCTGVLRVVGSEALRPLERQVCLQPLAATLRAGERLRLSLAPAAWPQVAVNGGDGREPRGGSTARHREITLTLFLEDAVLEIAPLLPPGPDGTPTDLAAN